MNDIIYAYCRLCAKLKSKNNLTDLQNFEPFREKIESSLKSLNCNLDFTESLLPKTVCLTCINTLNCVYTFMLSIDLAQAALNEIFLPPNIKKEDTDDDLFEEEEVYAPITTDPTEIDSIAVKTENTTDIEGNVENDNDVTTDIRGNVENDNDETTDIGGNVANDDDETTDIGGNVANDDDETTDIGGNVANDDDETTDIGGNVENDNDETMDIEGNVENDNDETMDIEGNVENDNDETTDIEGNVENDDDVTTAIEGNVENDNDVLEKEDVTKTTNVTTEVNTYLNWRDYSWKCIYCETQFPTVTELINHSMKYHKACNPFSCIDCKIRTGNLQKFLKHVRSHHSKLIQSCYECFKGGMGTAEYNKHRHSHKITDFKCYGCHTYFQSSDELTKHTSTFLRLKKFLLPLELEQDGLICAFCEKVCKNKRLLVSHLLSHTDRKRDYACDICGKCYLTKHTLSVHMKLHEDPENEQFQCDICKSTYRTKLYLQSHIARHYIIKLPCTKCDKSFRSVKTLNAHQILHTDLLPYACSHCKKKFKFKSGLNVHLRQHTGDKPYTCDICQKDFTNGSNYNKHMKRIHNKEVRFKRVKDMVKEGQDQ